jgi:hypothetical protein
LVFVQSSQAVWAATEMKYRKQLHQMRKHNVQLLDKLKEVRILLCSSSYHALPCNGPCPSPINHLSLVIELTISMLVGCMCICRCRRWRPSRLRWWTS